MVFNSTQPWLVDWSMHATDATYRNNSLDWCSLFCVQACVHRVVLLCSAVSPFHRMLLWYCDMRETKSEHARRRRQQTLRYKHYGTTLRWKRRYRSIHYDRRVYEYVTPCTIFSPHHLPSCIFFHYLRFARFPCSVGGNASCNGTDRMNGLAYQPQWGKTKKCPSIWYAIIKMIMFML